MIHEVAALSDHLILINPHVAFPREDIHVRPRLPVGMSLIPVRIAEGDMYAREFFVLQQNADELGERIVGAEGQLTDAIAILVGVAVVPKLLLQIFPRALHARKTSA